MNKEKIYKAALIIIGNEILSGRTEDKNLNFIALSLGKAGIRLSEVRVIPDIEEEIIDAVQAMSEKFDYVFTTGGIGPTHDDITSFCVGKAFRKEAVLNHEAVSELEAYYPEGQLTDARLRMAIIPSGASLIKNPVSGAPGFKLENVYVMAGVPNIMQAMLYNILPTLEGGLPILSKTVEAHIGESAIAKDLQAIEARYDDLEIGSYPSFKKGHVSVALVVRSVTQGDIDAAVKDLVALIKEQGVEPVVL